MDFKPKCSECNSEMMYLSSDACDEHEDCIVDYYHCPEHDCFDENHQNIPRLYSDDDRDDIFLEKD